MGVNQRRLSVEQSSQWEGFPNVHSENKWISQCVSQWLRVPGVPLLIVTETLAHLCFHSRETSGKLSAGWDNAGLTRSVMTQGAKMRCFICYISLASLFKDFDRVYSGEHHSCMTSAVIVTITSKEHCSLRDSRPINLASSTSHTTIILNCCTEVYFHFIYIL